MSKSKERTLKKGADMRSKDDTLGSYTGICEDRYEKPVQDADDL